MDFFASRPYTRPSSEFSGYRIGRHVDANAWTADWIRENLTVEVKDCGDGCFSLSLQIKGDKTPYYTTHFVVSK